MIKPNKNLSKLSNNSIVQNISKHKPSFFILYFALIGSSILLISNAATTYIQTEIENSNLNSSVTKISDNTSSGGSYIKFGTTANISRFPGYSNPKISGKAYWGGAVGSNTDPTQRYEIPTGKSLAVRRTFWGWDNNRTSMISTIKADIAANRLPYVSTKTPV